MKTRVMVVDDSASVRIMVRYSLQGAGYEVLEAVDGVEALEKLGDTDVQAMIVDVNMPRMNGMELIARLRKVPGHRMTPVLILTTEESRLKVQEGKAAGANGWLVKPFSPEQLVNILEKVMT